MVLCEPSQFKEDLCVFTFWRLSIFAWWVDNLSRLCFVLEGFSSAQWHHTLQTDCTQRNDSSDLPCYSANDMLLTFLCGKNILIKSNTMLFIFKSVIIWKNPTISIKKMIIVEIWGFRYFQYFLTSYYCTKFTKK